jgi:pimeloyl-ACP methyl ester carboxylesterase
VDEIAKDVIDLATILKSNIQNITLFGRSFGSYIVHRVLQIDHTPIDAVILDGVCVGQFCNASDWDIQRANISQQLFSKMATQNNSVIQQRMQGYKVDDLINALQNQDFFRLGYLAPNGDAVLDSLTYSFFDQSLRPSFFQRILDTYIQSPCFLFNIEYAEKSVSQWYSMLVPKSTSFMTTHIIRSELLETPLEKVPRYSLRMNEFQNSNWKTVPKSNLRYSWANFSKPLLMLHGEYDPQTRLENVQQFARMYNATGQTLIIMPGLTHNSILTSFTRNGSLCGVTLVSSFLQCPTCTLNTTCVQEMIGLIFDGDRYTSAYFDFYSDHFSVTYDIIILEILFMIIVVWCVVQFILVLVFFQEHRLKSRLFAPHFCTLYVLVLGTFRIATMWRVNIPYNIIWLVIYCASFVTSVSCVCMQNVKYFMLTSLYKSMRKKLPSSRIVKLLASKRVFAICPIIGVIWLLFGTVVLGLFYGAKLYFVHGVFIYVTGVACIFFSFVAIVVFIADIIARAMEKMTIREYFITSDPLCYRIDMVIMVIAFIFGALEITLPYGAGLISGYAMDIIFLPACLLIGGGSVIIAIIVDRIRGYRYQPKQLGGAPVTNDEHVKRIMNDEMALKLFQNYCEKEFSLENTYAFLDFQNVLESLPKMTDQEKSTAVDMLHNKYIGKNSEHEVNINSYDMQLFMNYYNQGNGDLEQVLRKILVALLSNLMDTYNRFKVTKECEECFHMFSVKEGITNALEM